MKIDFSSRINDVSINQLLKYFVKVECNNQSNQVQYDHSKEFFMVNERKDEGKDFTSFKNSILHPSKEENI